MTLYFLNLEYETVEIVEFGIFGGCAVVEGRKEQYRHGTGKIALEFPAGIIDKGETPKEAAIRELQEECGYVLDERRKTKDERGERRGHDKSNGDFTGSCSYEPNSTRALNISLRSG